MITNKYRAYDTITGWYGPIRDGLSHAEKDVMNHNNGCHRQGGFGSAVVIQEDLDCPGRSVDLEGNPVWPPWGRTTGSVRWRNDGT